MSNEEAGRHAADKLRDDLTLDAAPVGDIFELVHRVPGIDAMSIAGDEHEHGRCAAVPGTDRWVIAVATTTSPMRQRSSVAHELGHILLAHLNSGEDLTPGSRSDAEIQADAFARHLLLPMKAVFAVGQNGGYSRDRTDVLAELVQDYEVSPDIAAIQMRSANFIDRKQCDQLRNRWSAPSIAAQYGWYEHYASLAQASSTPRAPQRLVRMLIRGFEQGLISRDELRLWYGDGADLIEEPVQLHKQDTPDGADEDAFG